MKKSELKQIIREEIQRLNEGTSTGTVGQAVQGLENSLDDFIAGVKGEHGANDLKHPNAMAIVKEIQQMKKSLRLVKKAAGKELDFELWFRGLV